jgi:hypothetical protein
LLLGHRARYDTPECEPGVVPVDTLAAGFASQVQHSIGRDTMAEQIYGVYPEPGEASGEVATD